MSESLYERVKKRAYEIWEEEGQPWGRDAIHWERAHREIAAAPLSAAEPAGAVAQAAEAAPQAEAKAKPAKAPARRATKKAAG